MSYPSSGYQTYSQFTPTGNISLLNGNALFQSTPVQSQMGLIETLFAAAVPIAESFNGTNFLEEDIRNLAREAGVTLDGKTQAITMSFEQFNQRYAFDLYHELKPKCIYARYCQRQQYYDSMTQKASVYNPIVAFKIDYDACIVCQMALLTTLDIEPLANTEYIIQGYQFKGTSAQAITIKNADILSVKYSYIKDFIYHYIDEVWIGWCNTSGQSPQWHQQFPIEIINWYHKIIQDPAMMEVTKQWVREDTWEIAFDPWHMSEGNWAIQLKMQNTTWDNTIGNGPRVKRNATADTSRGFNEFGLYWDDDMITGIETTGGFLNPDANPVNFALSFSQSTKLTDVQITQDGTTKQLMGFNFDCLLGFSLGLQDATCVMSVGLPAIGASGLTTTTIGGTAYNTPLYQCVPVQGNQTFAADAIAAATTPILYPTSSFGNNGYNVPLQNAVLAATNANIAAGLTPTNTTAIHQFTSVIPTANTTMTINTLPAALTSEGLTHTFQKDQLQNIPIFLNTYKDPAKIIQWLTSIVQQYGQTIPSMSIRTTNCNVKQTVNLTIANTTTYGYLGAVGDTVQNGTGMYNTTYDVETKIYMVPWLSVQANTNGTSTNTSSVSAGSTNYVMNYAFVPMSSAIGSFPMIDGVVMALYPLPNFTSASFQVQPSSNDAYARTAQTLSIDIDLVRQVPTTSAADATQTTMSANFALYQSKLLQIYNLFSSWQFSDTNVLTMSNGFSLNLFATPSSPSFSSTYIGSLASSAVTNGSYTVSNTLSSYAQAGSLTSPRGQTAIGTENMPRNFTIQELISYAVNGLQRYCISATGAVSPYLNSASLSYMDIETYTFSDCDFQVNGLLMYQLGQVNSSGSANMNGYPNNSDQTFNLQQLQYNSAVLSQHKSSDYSPALRNKSYRSIHVPRVSHGVVDFYFPLHFFFVCQDLGQAYPMYACTAQSIVIQFIFQNPIAYINTFVAVKPQACDILDIQRDERVFINRIIPQNYFTNNMENTKFVLFYNKYNFQPVLQNIIANYDQYNWIMRNYERFYKTIVPGTEQNARGVIQELSRTVFFTGIFAWFTTPETIQIIQNKGAAVNFITPSVSRYELPIWSVLSYQGLGSTGPTTIGGAEAERAFQQYNSVYNLVPVSALQVSSESQQVLIDWAPWRYQWGTDFMMMKHTKQFSPLCFNNLQVFRIDPTYYQLDAQICNYSPAVAPRLYLNYLPKANSNGINAFGVIVVSECVNLSTIRNHLIQCKYTTRNDQ